MTVLKYEYQIFFWKRLFLKEHRSQSLVPLHQNWSCWKMTNDVKLPPFPDREYLYETFFKLTDEDNWFVFNKDMEDLPVGERSTVEAYFDGRIEAGGRPDGHQYGHRCSVQDGCQS